MSDDIGVLRTLLTEIQSNQRSITAALACLTYYIILTIDDEAVHVWRKRWTIPKVLYVVGRYGSLAYLITVVTVTNMNTLTENVRHDFHIPGFYSQSRSSCFCRTWFWFAGITRSVIFSTMVNTALALRINALYDQSKRVQTLLITLVIGQLAADVSLTAKTLLSIRPINFPQGIPYRACATIDEPVLTFMMWIPPIVVSCAFLVLTFIQFYRIVRATERIGYWPSSSNTSASAPNSFVGTNSSNAQRGPSTTCSRSQSTVMILNLWASRRWAPIAFMFTQDGFVYFFVNILVLFINLFIAASRPYRVYFVTEPWLVTFYAMMSSRLMLDLRSLTYRSAFVTTLATLHARTIPLAMASMGHLEGRNREISVHPRETVGDSDEAHTKLG